MKMRNSTALVKKAAKIKMLVFDIDGVMTDGRVGYSANDEVKFFNVRDGRSILNAVSFGFIVGFISGRSCEANRRRAKELKAHFIFEGQFDKLEALDKMLEKHGLSHAECMYMGDDIQDLPMFEKVGLSATVGDSPAYVKKACDYCAKAKGGHGAIRETLDMIFDAQGVLEKSINFFKGSEAK